MIGNNKIRGLPFTFLRKGEGFTLIEMLIVALIFSLVMGITTGLFVSAIKIQKYNLAHQQLLSQTSYALEYMTRSIRMAKSGGCATGNYDNGVYGGIRFNTYHDECWEFFLDGEHLKMAKNTKIQPHIYNTYNLISDDFIVNDFKIIITGDGAGDDIQSGVTKDDIQPRVTISIDIRGKGFGNQPSLRMQTTISQRNLDVP